MVKVLIEAKMKDKTRYRFDENTFNTVSKRELRDIYPYSYGFIIGTNTNDYDALDCYIISENTFEPGSIIECEIKDGFVFNEGDESDIKLLGIIKDDKSEYNFETCRKRIECFLREVFKEWPDVIISFNGLFGEVKAKQIIDERLKIKNNGC